MGKVSPEKTLWEKVLTPDRLLFLAGSSSPDDTLPLCLDLAMEASGGFLDSGGLYLLDRSGSTFNLMASKGRSVEFDSHVSKFGADSPTGKLCLVGELLFCDYCELPLVRDHVLESEGLRSTAVIPIRDLKGDVIGCFNLASHVHYVVGEEIRSRLKLLAKILGGTIGRIREDQHWENLGGKIISMLDSLIDTIFVITHDGEILWANSEASENLGYSKEELRGMRFPDICPKSESGDGCGNLQAIFSGSPRFLDVPITRKDGSLFFTEVVTTPGEWMEQEAVIAVCRDMTRHYSASRDLVSRNETLQTLLEEQAVNQRRRIELVDMIDRLSALFLSEHDQVQVFEQALGYLGAFSGADRVRFFAFEGRDRSFHKTYEWNLGEFKSFGQEGSHFNEDWFPWGTSCLRRTGQLVIEDVEFLPEEAQKEREYLDSLEVRSLIALAFPDEEGEVAGFLSLQNCFERNSWDEEDIRLFRVLAGIMGGSFRRHVVEETLKRFSQRLGSILEDSDALICRFTGEGIITYVNGAYCRCFDASEDDLLGKDFYRFIPEEQHQQVKDHFSSLTQEKLTVTYEHEVKAARSEKRWIRWIDRALFDEGGSLLEYQSVGIDVTDLREARESLREAFGELKESFEKTVDIMSQIVETRDPYTAGHQHRTAILARAIAGEMGLGEKDVEGIYFGSLLHDLGKMNIPSDILTKPGSLEEYEFSLIKMHPVHGERILKTADFPWPLWKMAAQHHERLDGSGYPYGLKGEEICMEARILSVADVVEAIMSHRPYRPALGLERAMEEIGKGKDRWFDGRVVEVCLDLFRNKGFAFDEDGTGK